MQYFQYVFPKFTKKWSKIIFFKIASNSSNFFTEVHSNFFTIFSKFLQYFLKLLQKFLEMS